MKKYLLILLTVLLGLGTWQGSAQETVEIGTGTGTTYYGPYNSLWGYSFVEQIYTAEEIDMTGSITSISFNNSSSGQTSNITVYMKLVNRSSFSSSSDYETVTAADIVYSGSHNFANGWSEITLDTPFDYDGASNLLIAVHEYTSGYSTQYFYYTSTSDHKLISFHSDSADPDPYNLGSYSGTIYTQNYRNNIKIEIMPSGNTCYTPLAPAISNVTPYGATLSWTPRENQTAWEVFCGSGVTDLDQVSWTPVTDTFYTFTGLTPATNYTAYVRTVCGTEVSNPRQVTFATEATCPSVPTGVTVSGITETTAIINWVPDSADNAWEVVVVPANMAPETGTPEATSTRPHTVSNLSDNTQYKVYVRTDCGNGDHSYWSNPATFTTLPFCSAPLNVAVSQITANSALVTWQPAVYGATDYTVWYGFASDVTYSEVTVDGLQLMLTNLDPDSTYDVMVFSNCPIGEGDTVTKTFTTNHCLVGGDNAIGEGTTTNYYIPVNNFYHYTYSQQIFLASEMGGPNELHSVSFQYAYSSPSTDKTNVTIYLGHTNKTEFSSTSDYIAVSGLQQVYTGHLNCQQGWNTFNFTTPFLYNGTDNLVLVVDDNSDAYDGSAYTFYVHSTGNSYRSLYYYSDSENPDPSNPTAVSTNNNRSTSRSNVIFGGNCDNDATCVRPNVYVSETSTYSVTLDWAPGDAESAWDVEYSVDDSTWTAAGTANTHPYEVSGLNSDTRYYFRVRSNCGSDVSDWSGAVARTECGPITQLPYFNNFDDVITVDGTAFITCWSRYTTNPERVVRCYGSATHSGSYALDFNYSPSCTTAAVTPMLDSSIPLNTVMLDFWAYSGLGQGWMEVGTMSDPNDFSTYEFYDTVRLSAASTWENLIIDFSNYTGNNQYIAFLEINGTTTSYIFDDFTINYSTNCFHPTNLAVEDYTNTTVTLSWTEAGSATAWDIEYGPVGFTPGTGTTVSAGTNPFTVDNLTPATTYDFYVSANCGGETSTPFGPVSATPGQYVFGTSGSDTLTTCGVMLYDNGGATGDYSSSSDFTLVLYPENPNAMMAVVGTLSTESCCDSLSIRDGVGTSGPWLAGYKGENQNVNVISQSGPLTLIFHSDGSVVKSGFAITATCVTCYPPTNIVASNPTTDGATLTWHGTGDSYVLFLDGDMTNGYAATDTTYTFTGLNASSFYSVQIAAICNGDTSMLSSAASFATGCGAVTITVDNPWTENFESYPGSGVQQFVCWETPVTEVVDNGTAPFVYCNYGQAAHSGTNTAEMKGSVNMLALPEFTNNLSELRVSFWATGYSYTNTNVEVGYITDVTDSTTFVPVFANAGVPGARGGSGGGHGNYMGPFSFSNVSVSNARIALRYTGPGASSGWNVDDFTVEIAPACESPLKSSVTATNIGGHVATITWDDPNPNHTAWTVYYKKTSETDWSTAPASDTTLVLTGLDPLSQYQVYVVTNCGTPETDPDATHTINFTTTVACPAPANLTLASISTDEATITWNGTASAYNVEYGVSGFTPGTGTTEVAYTESITLTNLDPSTSYTVYVNSDCSDNNDSLSTTVSFSFTTTQVPAPLPYTADFTQTNEWILNNGTCANYWTLGTVDSVSSMFVTNNGTTPSYNISSSSTVTAEKLLAVGDNASVVISFDVKIGGESSWDYLKVFFAPAESTYPAANSAPTYASYSYETYAMNFQNYLAQTGYTSYPYKLNLTQGNTLHVTAEMPNPNTNATSTSTAKLVFMWKNDSSGGTDPGAIISNVSVMVNNCPMPTNPTAENVTANSANISWTADADATAWVLEYQAAGSSTWTVENVTTTPAYTLNNLTPTTTYTVRVKTDCGDDESGYATLTFTTACASEIAPYSEDFSGFNTSVSPCWERFSGMANDVFAGGALTSTTSGWNFSSSNAFPVGHPKVNIYGSSCHYWLVSPAIDLSQLSSPALTFDLALTDYASADPIEDTTAQADDIFMVIISTDYGATWTAANATVWNNTGNGDYAYNAISHTGDSITISLSQYAGQTIRIAFYGESTASGGDNDLHIANVVVDNAGSGPGPVVTDPTVATNAAENIAQTTATLKATITNPDGVTITAKGFQWKATNGGTYTSVTGTGTGNAFTANLTNLTPNTSYTFKAFIAFNGTTVEGNEMTFTTEAQQQTSPAPTNVTASNITETTADIS
ncbi:MAG: fibronectin type III domain-containing protein, partial [Bacteroidales bacterium]|nr:fibronectin type III domain-containing protein [Bacteroidales bacterium]